MEKLHVMQIPLPSLIPRDYGSFGNSLKDRAGQQYFKKRPFDELVQQATELSEQFSPKRHQKVAPGDKINNNSQRNRGSDQASDETSTVPSPPLSGSTSVSSKHEQSSYPSHPSLSGLDSLVLDACTPFPFSSVKKDGKMLASVEIPSTVEFNPTSLTQVHPEPNFLVFPALSAYGTLPLSALLNFGLTGPLSTSPVLQPVAVKAAANNVAQNAKQLSPTASTKLLLRKSSESAFKPFEQTCSSVSSQKVTPSVRARELVPVPTVASVSFGNSILKFPVAGLVPATTSATAASGVRAKPVSTRVQPRSQSLSPAQSGSHLSDSSESKYSEVKYIMTSDDRFQCGYQGCGFISTKKFSLKRHWKRHTGDMPYPCPDAVKQAFIEDQKQGKEAHHHHGHHHH